MVLIRGVTLVTGIGTDATLDVIGRVAIDQATLRIETMYAPLVVVAQIQIDVVALLWFQADGT